MAAFWIYIGGGIVSAVIFAWALEPEYRPVLRYVWSDFAALVLLWPVVWVMVAWHGIKRS